MLTHIVQKGESLWQIANRYQISLDALIAANPQFSDPNYIMPGQQVNIPQWWQPELPDADDDDLPNCCNSSARPCIYTAARGDTLAGISSAWEVPLPALHYYNPGIKADAELAGGERIIIPADDAWPFAYGYQTSAKMRQPRQEVRMAKNPRRRR